jgi:hypothetical protein
MRQAVGRGQTLARDVRVDLRRPEARVAEDLLHGSKVGAAVEEVRGRRVTQGVRPDGSPELWSESAGDHVVGRSRTQPSAARPEEDGLGWVRPGT